MSRQEKDNPEIASAEALFRFLDAGPRTRPAVGAEGSEPDCPAFERYLQLAAGEAANGDSEALLMHAAECEGCARQLAMTVRAMEGNPSREETAAIEQLGATRSEWQRRLAARLAATPMRKRSRFAVPDWRWVSAAVTAAVAAAGVWAWHWQAYTPDRELATAYEQARTMELRVPEAGYAAMTTHVHTRGAVTDNEPAPLLEARARLARELERAPQDPRWLELQARADVLDERYDAAADVLDRLVAQGPVTADLLADAASAYYQRGLASGSELDRSTALDYLRRADELAPTDPVILFNEAIVMEDRGQMMNAVEVWNRYSTVEHDPKWAAEGKRKLAALEQTLNRLKNHESRIRGLLASPAAMDALAGDPPRLAALDEELATYELDPLLRAAYPAATDADGGPEFAGDEARGSPCAASCRAARRLLQALATSLEIHHHDFWLSDLLSPDIDRLPANVALPYAEALQLLGESSRRDDTGSPATGQQMAERATELFHRLKTMEAPDSAVAAAAAAGEQRASVEAMYALQRQMNLRECRARTQRLDATPGTVREMRRYPWIEAVARIVAEVCDDTPETRQKGSRSLAKAQALAAASNYPLLSARIQLQWAAIAQNAGDNEAAERISLAALRMLTAEDAPPIRVENTLAEFSYMEVDTPRTRVAELSLREMAAWLDLTGNRNEAAVTRMDLARAELRIGAMDEATRQLDLARQGSDAPVSGKATPNFQEAEIWMADALLERGDFPRAGPYLDRAAATISNYSDSWGLRTYAAARGQLELAQGHPEEAERTLETEIRASEGTNARMSDRDAAVQYARQDHDLYAELAAVWLAQGRPAENVLALWERFRLRSLGLPFAQCRAEALDCEQPRVAAARTRLGGSILAGQIVLLDRVLVYRMTRDGVAWTAHAARRQELEDQAEGLERAVSSPLTSSATAAKLGARLGSDLLPALPTGLPEDASLLLEPDPLLQNLPWPVLPAPARPLGIRYALIEMRSILAVNTGRGELADAGLFRLGGRALVVGASVPAGDERPLPEALEEAAGVTGFFPSPKTLLGEQANSVNVARALDRATVFHFAGHAEATQDGTRLLLAASSPGDARPWIDGAFLRSHPPRACRLAVLSACATGKLDASRSHPLQSVVETLSSLGVADVVATRWQIDSAASVPFMEAFYRNLAQGKSAAMALTLARRVQFAQPLLQNPYYWGAYNLSGGETRHSAGEIHARS